MPLEEFKKTFKPEYLKEFTEEEILEIKWRLEGLADVFFEMWLEDLAEEEESC